MRVSSAGRLESVGSDRAGMAPVELGGLGRFGYGRVAPGPVGPRWAGLASGRAAPGRAGLADSLMSCPGQLCAVCVCVGM